MTKNWMLPEAIDYYRGQGAPGNQQALIALLREAQEESGGAIPAVAVEEIAAEYQIKETFLQAIIKRFPSLRSQEAPHRLEVCGGPHCGKSRVLANFAEKSYGVKSGVTCWEAGFSYQVTGCMRNCGCGPNLKWDGVLYSKADPDLLRRLVEGK